MPGNSILLAFREIRRNVLRSFLTILGIVIGVAAVIIMVTIGGGLHPGGYRAQKTLRQPGPHGREDPSGEAFLQGDRCA